MYNSEINEPPVYQALSSSVQFSLSLVIHQHFLCESIDYSTNRNYAPDVDPQLKIVVQI